MNEMFLVVYLLAAVKLIMLGLYPVHNTLITIINSSSFSINRKKDKSKDLRQFLWIAAWVWIEIR